MTGGADPLFAGIDAVNCPNGRRERQADHSLLSMAAPLPATNLKFLSADGEATGGAYDVYSYSSEYYPGVNDALGGDPAGDACNPISMTLFSSWELVALLNSLQDLRTTDPSSGRPDG